MPLALVTGASAVSAAPSPTSLPRAAGLLSSTPGRPMRSPRPPAGFRRRVAVTAIAGDVADEAHRESLTRAVVDVGRLDLLVNNAGILGTSPLPPLASYPLDELERVYRIGVFAPLALTQRLLPMLLAAEGTVVNVSSDAGVEAYEGWGGYGSAKAALDQLSNVLAAEQPKLRVYVFDPGDMRTQMHQAAYPGEDISDRPEPRFRACVAAVARLAPAQRSLPGERHFAVSGSVEAAR